ncbi:putative DNA-binding transcriptional regulator YafY [Haloactinospora alba]|uniref:Putative DNA-binding transcriptional regulator YafY n=1 Tax=Haloactinospora alba TaxID=405555 RepID=A0A543N7H0_9ACTN|nr:YafY family protein [Haloactinospora alba]TQN27757.1 putative DNA-binding transcriptional regulator YafY [Haloactinospora alba]
MSDPALRLLRLLTQLQTGSLLSGPELAQRLGVSPRTLRRDVARLRELGYPVEAEPGAYGHYRLVAGAALPPLALDDEEAVAVVMGLSLVATGPLAGLVPASGAALEKIGRVLPRRLSRIAAALTASTDVVGHHNSTVDPEVLTVVARACRERLRLCFDYRSRAQHESRRRAEPYRVVVVRHRLYLLAWDIDRSDWRTFRLDRVSGPEPRTRFSPRPEPAADPAEYVHERVSLPPVSTTAVVRFHAPAREVASRLQVDSGRLEELGPRECRLTSHADTVEWHAVTLATAGLDYTIEGPEELASCTRRLAARMNRALPEGGEDSA